MSSVLVSLNLFSIVLMICVPLWSASLEGLRCGLFVPKIPTALSTMVPLNRRVLSSCSNLIGLLYLLLIVGMCVLLLLGTSLLTFPSLHVVVYSYMSVGE